MGTQQTSSASAADTTKIRQDICKDLAAGIHAGAYGLQFRFLHKDDTVSDVWLYRYHGHEWHKQRDYSVDAADMPGLYDQLELIASREFADVWNCRRIDHSDRTDFELKLNPESMQAHLNANLESYLMGCLFSGHHDSGKDSRRRIRFQGH